MVDFDSRITLPSFSISRRDTPVMSEISLQLVPLTAFLYASNPCVYSSMNSMSARPPERVVFARPLKSAKSPFTATGTCRSAIDVPEPMTSNRSCGCLNRLIPVSSSGLMLTTEAPARLASLRAVSIRG